LKTLHKNKQEIEEEMRLIREAQQNPARFTPLYEMYYKPVIQFIYRRVGDADLAADLTSDVFIKIITYLPKFKDKGLPFSSLIFKIAVNEVNMFYRKSSKKRTLSLEDEKLKILSIEVINEEKEEKIEKIISALQKLSTEEIQFVELRFFEDCSFKEIGELLDMTENNAKVRTYRILDKIKKYL